jgi:hypothetical protein
MCELPSTQSCTHPQISVSYTAKIASQTAVLKPRRQHRILRRRYVAYIRLSGREALLSPVWLSQVPLILLLTVSRNSETGSMHVKAEN